MTGRVDEAVFRGAYEDGISAGADASAQALTAVGEAAQRAETGLAGAGSAATAAAGAVEQAGAATIATETAVRRAGPTLETLRRRFDEEARAAAGAAAANRKFASDLESIRREQAAGAIDAAKAAEWERRAVVDRDAAIARADARAAQARARYAPTAPASVPAQDYAPQLQRIYEQSRTPIERLRADVVRLEHLRPFASGHLIEGLDRQVSAARAELARLEAAGHAAGRGTGLAAHQVTNLSYQLQDVAVQLAGGQNPLLIMMQQGPQAVMAVEGLENAMRLLASPAGLAALAVAALAGSLGVVVAAYSGYAAELGRVAIAQRATGYGVAESISGLDSLARAASAAGGITASEGRIIATAMVSAGRIGSAAMADLIGMTRDWAAVTGQSVDAAGTDLARLAADPARAVSTLNEALNLLSDTESRRIVALARSGAAQEAQAILIERQRARIHGAAEETGWWSRQWHALGLAAGSVGQALADAGARAVDAQPFSQKIAELEALVARRSAWPSYRVYFDQKQRELDQVLELQRQEQLLAAQRAKHAEALRQGRAAGDVARSLDPLAGVRDDLEAKAAILKAGLSAGTVDAGADAAAALERVSRARETLSTEVERAQALAQAEAQALTLSGIEREVYLARMRAEIGMRGQLLTDQERALTLAQAEAAVVGRALGVHQDAVRDLGRRADAADRMTAAIGAGAAAVAQAGRTEELIAAARARGGDALADRVAREGVFTDEIQRQYPELIRQSDALDRLAGAEARRATTSAVRDLGQRIAAQDRMTAAIGAGVEAEAQAGRTEELITAARARGGDALADRVAREGVYTDEIRRQYPELLALAQAQDRLGEAEGRRRAAEALRGARDDLTAVQIEAGVQQMVAMAGATTQATAAGRQLQTVMQAVHRLHTDPRWVGAPADAKRAWLELVDAQARVRGEMEATQRLQARAQGWNSQHGAPWRTAVTEARDLLGAFREGMVGADVFRKALDDLGRGALGARGAMQVLHRAAAEGMVAPAQYQADLLRGMQAGALSIGEYAGRMRTALAAPPPTDGWVQRSTRDVAELIQAFSAGLVDVRAFASAMDGGGRSAAGTVRALGILDSAARAGMVDLASYAKGLRDMVSQGVVSLGDYEARLAAASRGRAAALRAGAAPADTLAGLPAGGSAVQPALEAYDRLRAAGEAAAAPMIRRNGELALGADLTDRLTTATQALAAVQPPPRAGTPTSQAGVPASAPGGGGAVTPTVTIHAPITVSVTAAGGDRTELLSAIGAKVGAEVGAAVAAWERRIRGDILNWVRDAVARARIGQTSGR